MSARILWQAASLVGVLVLAGCSHTKQTCCKPPAPCSTCGPQPGAQSGLVVVPGANNVVPGDPVPYNPPSGQGSLPPGAQPFVPNTPPGNQGLVPAQATQPVQPQLQPQADARMPVGEKYPDVQLEPPVVASAFPSDATAQKPANGNEARDATPVLDIPNFALAKMRVATGLKPFPDGIAWLKAKGYTTVLHIRAPGEIDPAAQRQFQNQNLRYLSLEVSPELLNRDLVEKFNRLVTDSSNQPLFVYDQDGSLAGALWLLHFRVSEGVSEDKARLEAERLGFKPTGDGNFKAMAEAVNRYLRSQNP